MAHLWKVLILFLQQSWNWKTSMICGRKSAGTPKAPILASTLPETYCNSKISLEKPMRWKMKLQSFSEKFGLNFKGALLLCMSVLSTFLASFFLARYVSFWPLGFLGFRRWFFGEFGFVYGITHSWFPSLGKGAGLMKGRGEFQTPKVDISTSHPRIWLFQFSSVFPYIL